MDPELSRERRRPLVLTAQASRDLGLPILPQARHPQPSSPEPLQKPQLGVFTPPSSGPSDSGVHTGACCVARDWLQDMRAPLCSTSQPGAIA